MYNIFIVMIFLTFGQEISKNHMLNIVTSNFSNAGDFLQLLFVSLQAYVFSIEASPERVERYGGGDNADILADVEQNKPIPCEDFTLEQT